MTEDVRDQRTSTCVVTTSRPTTCRRRRARQPGKFGSQALAGRAHLFHLSSRVLDESRDLLRLGQHHGVAAGDLDCPRASPLRHRALSGWWNHGVLRRYQVVRRLRLPRGLRDPGLHCLQTPRDLCGSHEARGGRIDVGGEGRRELRRIDEQVAILRRQQWGTSALQAAWAASPASRPTRRRRAHTPRCTPGSEPWDCSQLR